MHPHGQAASRIRKNAAYFRVNYLVVILATTVVSFVMHPTSLLVLAALMAAWIYVLFIRQQPITMGGRELSHKEKLIGMGAVSFITIFFLTRCVPCGCACAACDSWASRCMETGHPVFLTLTLGCFPTWLRSVGTVFFSALAFSCAAIALHGAFREPDNLFVDDAEVRRGKEQSWDWGFEKVACLLAKPCTAGGDAKQRPASLHFQTW